MHRRPHVLLWLYLQPFGHATMHAQALSPYTPPSRSCSAPACLLPVCGHVDDRLPFSGPFVRPCSAGRYFYVSHSLGTWRSTTFPEPRWLTRMTIQCTAMTLNGIGSAGQRIDHSQGAWSIPCLSAQRARCAQLRPIRPSYTTGCRSDLRELSIVLHF